MRVPEDENAARLVMEEPLPGLHLLLISGGASVGEHDFTRRLLESLGFAIHVSRTTARPGKPLIVGQREGTIAFGLPGNPLAHFVCLNLYVRPVLERFAGRPANASAFHSGRLATDLAADGNSRETFWPARWFLEQGQLRLRPLPWRSSGDLTALATANAVIRVPCRTERWEAGREVEFTFTDQRL
jgi:molybdopterin molybdotransferase